MFLRVDGKNDKYEHISSKGWEVIALNTTTGVTEQVEITKVERWDKPWKCKIGFHKTIMLSSHLKEPVTGGYRLWVAVMCVRCKRVTPIAVAYESTEESNNG